MTIFVEHYSGVPKITTKTMVHLELDEMGNNQRTNRKVIRANKIYNNNKFRIKK